MVPFPLSAELGPNPSSQKPCGNQLKQFKFILSENNLAGSFVGLIQLFLSLSKGSILSTVLLFTNSIKSNQTFHKLRTDQLQDDI
ncbi:hypothetical protein PSHT_08561 [Puccinia striiformis]|uniref:Uncharacterized protein n=1 Tax=Puccinia striiformis TaxID=27350 RepID=A0A2S4VMZ5_9BASI|nr:hypothetical protein PSHT_08561 [Puccinia striiformis]